MPQTFAEYRKEIYDLHQDNGLQPFSKKMYYATLQGVGTGLAYGALTWAFYPDKFAFAHKNTITAGPSRGMEYLQRTVMRPMVYFTTISVTFAGVESFLEEIRGSHKDPWNTAGAGFAAGIVMGGFFTRRFDIASMTGIATGMLMGAIEVNGPNLITNPNAHEKYFPEKVPVKFEESEALAALKEKYPRYKNN